MADLAAVHGLQHLHNAVGIGLEWALEADRRRAAEAARRRALAPFTGPRTIDVDPDAPTDLQRRLSC